MLSPRVRLRLVVVVAVLIISIGSLREMAAAEPTGTTGQESAAEKQTDPLAVAVDKAIEISTRRYLTGSVHTPWQIMHGMLALRQEYRIKQGDKKVNAVEWMSRGAKFRGDPWFEKTRFGGRAHPYSKDYAFEGHPNQFLAVLAMADIPHDHKFVTRSEETITVDDMVKHAQMQINAQEEITWTLWALSHYLGTDAKWRNKNGEAWSIERLVRMQAREPVRTAACGGSHGLFALTFARNAYLKTGRPLRGVWLEADQKIQRYIYEARYYQNADGTFSTNYFSGKRFSRKFETRLNTSGHTLEFLVLALPQQRLKEEWVRRGIHALSTDLINHRRDPAECGSLYHAVDALVIYRNRTHPRPAAQVAAAKPAPAADETPEKKPVEK